MQKKNLASFLAVIIIVFSLFNNGISVMASEKNELFGNMIQQYADFVNNKEIDSYVSMFAPEIQNEMKNYLDSEDEDSFFFEDSIDIVEIKEGNKEIAIKEAEQYQDVAVFRVTEKILYKKDVKRETCEIFDGLNTNDFVFVKDHNKWYLYRISASDTEEELNQQNEMNLLSTTLSCPSTTVIYFTKSANSTYWGVKSKSLSFSSSYLKNVLPKEWYISRYYNSAYANATALASKTYGWYFTKHPKWNYSPYYSNMKDNSSDQNYLYSAYSDLNSSTYQGYENTVLSFISNKVIVKSNNNAVLEVHYNATTGTEHSGQMSASGCWSMARNGDSYSTILHYYYDYSNYTGTNVACSIATY